MTSIRSASALLSLLGICVLLSPTAFASPEIIDRVVVESASFESAGYTVQVVGTVTEDDVSKLVFKARNTGAVAIDRIQVEIEEWNEAGWLEGGSSYVIWTELRPGEERLFSEPIRTAPGASAAAYVLRSIDAEESGAATVGSPSLSRKFAISTCANYCDRCSDKAGDRCLGGVMEVSCSCDETSARCSYSCYPPPV